MRTTFKSEIVPSKPMVRTIISNNENSKIKPTKPAVQIFLHTKENKNPYNNELNLSGTDLREIPSGIFLRSQTIESLILQNNKLTILPENIGNLTKLKIIKLDHNLLTCLPNEIANLQFLENISIASNKLVTFPIQLCRLGKTLKSLNLSDNLISVLPNEISQLTALEELLIQNNRFINLPCNFQYLRNLSCVGLEWFLYTPLACCIVKGVLAMPVCDSLRELCANLQMNKMNECSLGAFLKYFCEQLSLIDIKTGRSLFHQSITNNHIGVLKGLKLAFPDSKIIDKEGNSPIILSIKHGNREIIKNLLVQQNENNNPNINFKSNAASALSTAIYNNDLWTIKTLFSQKLLNSSYQDELKNTPLNLLFDSFIKDLYQSEIIGDFLLLSGVKPNQKNTDKLAPLHIAARKGYLQAIKWAIRSNKNLKNRGMEQFDLNLGGGSENSTPLHLAATYHFVDIVKVLLENGADPLLVNNQQKIPRQIVRGNYAIIKMLRKAEKNAIAKLLAKENTENITENDSVDDESIVGNEGIESNNIRIPFSMVLMCDENHNIERQTVYHNTEIENQTQPKFGKLTINMDIVNKGLLSENTQCFQTREGYQTMAGIGRGTMISSTKFGNSKPINMFYLRDKILNNRLTLHERYAALNHLIELKHSSQISQIFTDLLEKLLTISSTSLQLFIIQNAQLAQQLVAIPLLTQYKPKVSPILQLEISNILEILKSAKTISSYCLKPKHFDNNFYTRKTQSKLSCSIRDPPKEHTTLFRSSKYFGDTVEDFNSTLQIGFNSRKTAIHKNYF